MNGVFGFFSKKSSVSVFLTVTETARVGVISRCAGGRLRRRVLRVGERPRDRVWLAGVRAGGCDFVYWGWVSDRVTGCG